MSKKESGPTCVYKGDKVEVHETEVADRMKAKGGWFDNPTDAKKNPGRKPNKDK